MGRRIARLSVAMACGIFSLPALADRFGLDGTEAPSSSVTMIVLAIAMVAGIIAHFREVGGKDATIARQRQELLEVRKELALEREKLAAAEQEACRRNLAIMHCTLVEATVRDYMDGTLNSEQFLASAEAIMNRPRRSEPTI